MSEIDPATQPRTLALAGASPVCAAGGHPSLPIRHDGWTLARQRAFLEALADGASVREAARMVGLSHVSAYALRRRAEGRGFAQGWDAAVAMARRERAARAEELAWERAVGGTVRQHFYHGELVGETREYSGIM